jgi:hypothetical protein
VLRRKAALSKRKVNRLKMLNFNKNPISVKKQKKTLPEMKKEIQKKGST